MCIRDSFLWGYSDEDLCFVDPYDKSTSTTNAWVDVTNPELPNGATGAIYERVNRYTDNGLLGLRPNGSTHEPANPSLTPESHDFAPIGIDSAKRAEQKIDRTEEDLYLWGHLGSDFVPFINPYDVTPSTIGAWTTVDVSAYVPQGATGVLLTIEGKPGTSGEYKVDVRKTGSTDDHVSQFTYGTYLYNNVRFVMVGLDENRRFDVYLGSDIYAVYLWGYFKAAVAHEITLTDAVGLLDSYSRSWSSVKPLADSLGLYDSVSPLRLSLIHI